jgi:hypothetical protein
MSATPKRRAVVHDNETSKTLATLAARCGKPVVALRTIQKSLGLHVPADGLYSEAYCRFLEKVVALQALHVSRASIVDIFEKEKQILRLLHVDSLGSSPIWYLDACAMPETKTSLQTRLLLSGHDLGFTIDAAAVQDALDFGSKEKELFKGAEMGEDVRKLLADYLHLLAGIRQTVAAEVPVVRNALGWAARVLPS